MKKILIFALAVGTLVSCDPLKDSGTFDITKVNAEQLLQGATFSQYDAITAEDGTVSYQESADGNYVKYNIPAVGAVNIYFVKPDGSKSVLDYGKNAGMFYFRPTRGSDPQQNIYIQYIDADLNDIIAQKTLTLQVAQELSAGDKLLCSNGGSKKWFWYPTSTNSGAVWGNGGYQAGPVSDPSVGYSGAWWGCGVIDGDCPDTFEGQLKHSANGALIGEEQSGSYMIFNEEGSITKFSPEGVELGKGTFKLVDYDGGKAIDASGNVAYLETAAGSIMWPWMINNSDHFEPTRFEVAYLSAGNLMLVYAPEGTGAWSECTWWSFGNWDDAEGFMTSDKWGWYPTTVNGGAVWGNAGYQAGSQDDPNTINGAWWGCGVIDGDCPDKFDGQMQHSAIGSLSGQEYMGSYMTFNEDGTMAKFDPDGNQLGEGTWKAEMNTTEFNVGTLTTSAGAILWPWQINSGAFEPTEFEIGYMSSTNIILIYAAPGTGAWSECTWWSFSKRTE